MKITITRNIKVYPIPDNREYFRFYQNGKRETCGPRSFSNWDNAKKYAEKLFLASTTGGPGGCPEKVVMATGPSYNPEKIREELTLNGWKVIRDGGWRNLNRERVK